MNSPQIWNVLLDSFMPPGSIVAGGAVRDYLLGYPHKDIDVFTTEEPSDRLKSKMTTLSTEQSDEYNALDVTMVWQGRFFGQKVDLVWMPNANIDTIIDSFDFGITRCSYKSGAGFDVRMNFWLDRLTHTVTLLTDARGERTKRRFHRFNDRHGGDWSFRS